MFFLFHYYTTPMVLVHLKIYCANRQKMEMKKLKIVKCVVPMRKICYNIAKPERITNIRTDEE